MNKLDYLLACLGEECGEVQQVVGKSLRFGITDHNPKNPEYSNFELLRAEMHDILAVYQMICDELGIEDTLVQWRLDDKKDKVMKWYSHAEQVKV